MPTLRGPQTTPQPPTLHVSLLTGHVLAAARQLRGKKSAKTLPPPFRSFHPRRPTAGRRAPGSGAARCGARGGRPG